MRRWCIWASCVWVALSTAWSQAVDDQFGQTAPPKVNVTLEDHTPSDVDRVGVPETESADQTIAEINAAWDDAATENEVAEQAGGRTEDDTGFSPASAALQATASLLAVLGLFVFLTYLVKRFGKRSPMLAGQRMGQVIGRVALSPQASLHFVRTNGEVLVVGVTQQAVTLLRTFDAEDFETAPVQEPTVEPEASAEGNFLDQLRDVQESMGTMPGVDKDIDSLKGELQRLKQYFQDSARARE